MAIKRYPAQISFVQASNDENCWIGRLVNREGAIDTVTGLPARDLTFKCLIKQPKGETYFVLTIQGASAGGRRHIHHSTLNDAQAQAIKWAGRRFKIPVEV